MINTSARTASDALVFFGATGDLAYKQIFPALQALIGRDAPALAALIARLHADETRCRAASNAGLALIRQNFSAAPVTAALQAAIDGHAAPLHLNGRERRTA